MLSSHSMSLCGCLATALLFPLSSHASPLGSSGGSSAAIISTSASSSNTTDSIVPPYVQLIQAGLDHLSDEKVPDPSNNIRLIEALPVPGGKGSRARDLDYITITIDSPSEGQFYQTRNVPYHPTIFQGVEKIPYASAPRNWHQWLDNFKWNGDLLGLKPEETAFNQAAGILPVPFTKLTILNSKEDFFTLFQCFKTLRQVVYAFEKPDSTASYTQVAAVGTKCGAREVEYIFPDGANNETDSGDGFFGTVVGNGTTSGQQQGVPVASS